MSTPEKHEKVTLTINGQEAVAAPGENLLTVARRMGIEIPTLCYHKAILPYSACRLCLVEVKWGKRSKMVVSCVYEPWEGDVVVTDSPRVRSARRMVLEFLLARCPKVKQIRDLAKEYGATGTIFQATPGDNASERCILCGLCVRVCAEGVGQQAIGYAGRGAERTVTSPFDGQNSECIGCGACVHVCPTGAIHSRDIAGQRHLQEWHTVLPLTACRACGEAFAAARHLAVVQPRVPLSEEMMATCPACRRREACKGMVGLWLTERVTEQQ